jgi:hypothetical protein
VVDPTLAFEIKVNAANTVMATLRNSGFLDDYANFISEVTRDFAQDYSKTVTDAELADLSNAIKNFDVDTRGRNVL